MDEASDGLLAILGYLFLLMLIFGLSLFAAKDSTKNRVSFIERQYNSADSTIWFFVCLLVCGLGFLYYLYRRSVVLQIKESRQPAQVEDLAPDIPGMKNHPERIITAEDTLETQLETLQRLKEKGLITESEWEQKKRQILGL